MKGYCNLSHPIQACLQQADVLKAEGNDHFRSKRWSEALAAYKAGLSRLPNTIQNGGPSNKDDNSLNEYEAPDKPGQDAFSPSEFALRRAVLNANIGACYVKLVITNVLVYTVRH